MDWGAATLRARRKRQLVVIVGRDEQSRDALIIAGRWQRALASDVHVLLVTDPKPATPDAIVGLRAWSADHARLELTPQQVTACASSDFLGTFAQAMSVCPEVVMCPGSPDLSATIGAIPLHVVWNRVAAVGGSLLLTRSAATARRVLVLTDGTPRTLPVLQSAFEIADSFDVQLSHLDTIRVPTLWSSRREVQGRAHSSNDSVSKYLRVVHGLIDTVNRAQRELRPDLILMGAAANDGGGTASALSSAPLPCSVLMVPLRYT